MNIVRVVLAVTGIVSVFIAPPWVSILVMLLLALRWRAIEILAMGGLIDLTWLSDSFLYGIPIATLLAVLLLWMLEPFRRELLVARGN